MRQVRYNGQSYKDDWLEWDSETTIPDQIIQYLQNKYWVYDSDSFGNETFQFVVRENLTDTYWEVEHVWWIDYDPDWTMNNEFDIKQVLTVNFDYPRINRAWLKLTQR